MFQASLLPPLGTVSFLGHKRVGRARCKTLHEARSVTENLKLMAVTAHPDDESLGMGGTLARYASENVETCVVCATRGERGRYRDGTEKPDPQAMARIRERELRRAAEVLGVTKLFFLDYLDGELDRADPEEAVARIAHHLRAVRPQVVLTFDQAGAYGHPDHIAICQLTTAAVVQAAHAGTATGHDSPPHAVSKLYYMAWGAPKWAAYQEAFKTLRSTVDGIERQASPWPDWAITTHIDTRAWWPQVWQAVSCHESQIVGYETLKDLRADHHQALWGTQEFYRVFSTVNGGRTPEADVFEGLR